MKIMEKFFVLVIFLSAVNGAHAASSKIGIEGFLTSDVTAPIEVFRTATKKSWFSSYEVVSKHLGHPTKLRPQPNPAFTNNPYQKALFWFNTCSKYLYAV